MVEKSDDCADLVNNLISKLRMITFTKLDWSAACGVSQPVSQMYEQLSSDLPASAV